MQKLVWQNANGDEINLTGGNYGITEWEGFSNASLNIQNQQVPFQDGAVFLDALIEPRELSVTLKMQDKGNLEERYRMRRELIHSLNPKLGEGYLIYTNDFISKRIKCIPQIPLFETHNSDTRGTPKASLAWTACEPYWEDLEETEVQIGKGQEVEIINNGDVPVQIKADFDTSCNNFVFQNLTTRQKIQIAKNIDWNITLNTNIGEKKIEKDSFIAQYNRGGSFQSIVALDDRMLCVGTQFIIIDLNGNETTVKTDVVTQIYDVVYAKGLYIICGGEFGTSYKFIKVSKDLETWESATYPSVGSNVFTLISFEENLFKVKLSNDTYLTSTDGYNWTQQSTTISKSKTQIKVDDLYIKVDGNKIKTSTDNSTWTDIYTVQENVSLTSLCYFFGNYYFVGYAGTILRTSDLNSFEYLKYSPLGQLRNVTVSDDYVFFVQNAYGTDLGALMRSSNLNDWSIIPIATNIEIIGLYFAKGLLFVLADRNKVLISANNGDTFETVTISDEQDFLISIGCYNDVFYLFGYSNTYVSTDGYNWSILFSEVDIDEVVYIPYKMAIYKGNCYIVCRAWGGSISSALGILKTNDFVNFESVYIDVNANPRAVETTISSNENNLIVTVTEPSAVSNKLYLYQTSNGLNYIKSDISSKLDYAQCVQSLFINGVLWIINSSNRAYYTKDFKTFNYIDCVALSLYISCICFFKNNILFGGGSEDPSAMVIMSYSKFESENIINELTKDSNMDFKLNIGENNLLLLTESGNASGIIKYRQKYLGV